MTKSALVVGAGFGGIATALRLRALGLDVHVVERQESIGGRAQAFEVDGYRHDAGPTVITAPFLFDELFELFGERREDHIEFRELTPWYRFIFPDGDHFDYGGTLEKTLAEIRRIEPKDQAGYESLVQHSKAMFDIGFSQLAHQPFHEIKTMAKQIPHLARLRSDRSVWAMVCKHLSHDKLRQAFSIQPLLVGGSPFDTTSIYGLIHYLERAFGIFFAMGGTGAIVEQLKQLMLRQGITFQTGTTVSEILTSQNKVFGVKLESGEVVTADCVVFNGDPMYLYRELLPENKIPFTTRLKRDYSKLSMGLYVLFSVRINNTATWPTIRSGWANVIKIYSMIFFIVRCSLTIFRCIYIAQQRPIRRLLQPVMTVSMSLLPCHIRVAVLIGPSRNQSFGTALLRR